MKKIIFLSFFAIFVLNAKDITIEFLNSKPRSIYKDYYIWRFLDQDTDSKTALKLLGDTKRVTIRFFLKFAKKIDDKAYKKVLKCFKMHPKEFINTDADCIKIGFSIYDATKLSKKELLKVDENIKETYPKLHKFYKILLSDNPFKTLSLSDKDSFFAIFNHVGSDYRKKYLDHHFPKNRLDRYLKDKRFNRSIKIIVTDPKLKELQRSILNINSAKLNSKSNFFLFLNALKFGKKGLAQRYLELADKKFYYRFDKDKALFWRYLLTNDDSYLNLLTKSFDINIYTLFAYEKLHKFPTNIADNLKCKNIKPHIDIIDPFAWLKILNKLNKKDANLTKLALKFSSCEELPYKAFALERKNYKNNYFISPYKRYIEKYPLDIQALLLAIARQESRFIPPSISTSYALGMMQFMPFLAKAIAKKRGIKNFDIDEMFIPEVAYSFAKEHISYLQNKLYHPLFIAYAYNGGIGFTLRMLKSGLFEQGEFEPFLSMELVPYDESKRYGKKVLANYVIYKKILGNKVKITTLFQKLK